MSGQWKRVRGVTLTTVHGRAVARIDGRPGQQLRAVVPALNNVAGSTSRSVTLDAVSHQHAAEPGALDLPAVGR